MYSIKKISNKNIWYVLGVWIMVSITLTAAPIKIMPVGDSITEGIAEIPQTPDQNTSYYPKTQSDNNLTQTPDRIAYRGKLWDLLKNEGYEIDFVGSKDSGSNYASADFDTDHEGYGGKTSAYIKDNINTWLTNNPADIVLLHIGTNDGGSATPIGTTVNNVNDILNTIFTKNANAKVFVARIIEARRVHQNKNGGGIVSPENPRGYWLTKDLNDAIESMINNHPQASNIKVVDMESAASLEYDTAGLPNDMQPYHTEDGRPDYHPNANGYAKMAEKWFDEIVASGWIIKDVVEPIDTEAPEITVDGSQIVILRVGSNYNDAGATAIDNVDGDITDKVIIVENNVDTHKVGKYSILYSVTDAAGNTSQVRRTIKVLETSGSNAPEWYIYEKSVNEATITPLNSSYQSILRAEGIDAQFITQENMDANTVSFKYKFDGGNQAYITANENAEVKTGFLTLDAKKSTLVPTSAFKAGTKSVMKKDSKGKIMIENTIKMNKNEILKMN